MTTPPPYHPRSRGGSARGRQVSSRRVRDLILASIRNGTIDIDAQLVEEDLMIMFNSSRGSVRAALNELSETGVVIRRPRVGTRVNRRDLGVALDDISATGGELVHIQVTDQCIVPTFPLIRERLRIDDDVVRLVENSFIAHDEIIGMRSAYFSPRFNADPNDLRDKPMSMARTLAEFFGVAPGGASVSIGAERADERTARLLDVRPGETLLSREILYTTADGTPVEIVFDRFRADRIRFESQIDHSDVTWCPKPDQIPSPEESLSTNELPQESPPGATGSLAQSG
ncbi:GntR family transcriptional regulator [Gordonia amicalis]|uniref:GntR family transcriptional regulator n=1 Tax=Gordonia amicalis TaxID=89053 RepID=A0AAE4R6X9_9ACTN|nr:GntR family transcriptional regulator [Gordonia amicalis]MCZ4578384.1 GntR family transcriptional regulator [Gordonia amicalis]MCZ4650894.1 GntR family transcriptional regulator [Gordonia amicalis]MDJ0452970.1 GntR family transcriptional regulator [Gordonia amicalis]MDV6307161.1 GntR family transcriptional regulator [Gordonia amicalis]MDV6312957.1 GntR family transcriptional regulator [Gordonia amicalis]